MAMDEDQELLQDFLVEAGEILDQLCKELVELENRPQDNDLLNSVFRGFHTIKGGASFLSLDNMVALCHRSEDVFNILRNGGRRVDSGVMDVILPVLDELNAQFDELRSGHEPHAPPKDLLSRLDVLSIADVADSESAVPTAGHVLKPKPSAVPQSSSPAVTNGDDTVSDDITNEEFEALLDQLPDVRKGVVASSEEPESMINELSARPESPSKIQSGGAIAESDEITEEEFDALLVELHSKGKHGHAPANQTAAVVSSPTKSVAVSKNRSVTNSVVPHQQNKSRESSQAETTVRVDTKRLDDIMNMVGELVLVRNRMATLEITKNDEEMSKVVANLDLVTADLQAAVMKTRMQPIKKVFGRFPRLVRDLARNLDKEVNLELQGEDTDLDKNLVEALADPLVHLVRNAVDHGIESPDDRIAKGKPRAGTVILTAEQEGDHILLTIEDDGKGMDPEKLRKSAVDKGILDAETATRLDDKDCYNLIFQPGFSTTTEISNVSGRGVGMDVVKNRIVQLNGNVEVDSRVDKGSVIIIKVPLTLAIMPTLMVMLSDQIFALPLASVNEIFHVDLTRTNVVDGQLVVMVRNKALPLFYLKHWLVRGCANDTLPKEGHVVVVNLGMQRIGFVVDTLIGQEEVVIKPLGALLHGMKGLAGATITGDGRIALILDIPGLMQTYTRRVA